MVTLAQLELLQTPEGTEILTTLAEAPPTPATTIAIATRLRKGYPADLVTAAMSIAALRVHASAKFEHPERLWFTRDGLEQATSQPIAAYRAGRFDGMAEIVDLCCGIGGDLLALARENPSARITAVDRDPLHLEMAKLNAHALGVDERITFIEEDVRSVTLPSSGGIFIDPARRSGKGRMALGDSEPPLEWCVDLASPQRGVGIKAAPGLDHTRVPAGWEFEAIALGSDLKEATIWSPRLARSPRTATIMSGRATFQLHPIPGESVPLGEPAPGDTLLDPNPAITRAGLVEDLARHIGPSAAMIDPKIAFLVSSSPVQTPFARSLSVVASIPWHERTVKDTLRALDAGPVDLRRRGLAGDVDAITRRLRGTGDRPFTIAMTRVMDQPWAIICEEPT
jgi:SAM-dependent methyltransferase